MKHFPNRATGLPGETVFFTQEFESLCFVFVVSSTLVSSSKVGIKMQTEEPSAYLMQNIIFPNSYIKSIVEKARPGPDRLQ